MATKKDKSSKKTTGAAAKTKVAAESKVVANVKLVAAIKSFDGAKAQVHSYLIDMAEIIQNEQCTRAEVVASIMEARGVEKSTAESQYSRHKAIFTDPDALEAARTGEVEVREVRESKKKQKNPSQKKQNENREKRFAKAVTEIVKCAKEAGQDIATVLNILKAKLKDAGVK